MVIHNAAAVGFSNAGSYDAHRPSYPSEAATKLLQHLGLEGKNGARIIDQAAGTGKLAELLSHRPERFEVIVVEPHDKMRDTLNTKALKGVSTQSGTADNMGVEDG